MPLDYKDYPPNWKTEIVPAIRKRSDDRCEGSPAYPDCKAVLADLSAYRQGEPLVSEGSAWAESVGLAEDDLSGEPKLPEGLAKLLAPKRIQVVRDWAATMFRRHAPEYIQQMQGTTQQLDAAVSHYRRRRNRLAKLLEEARGLDGIIQACHGFSSAGYRSVSIDQSRSETTAFHRSVSAFCGHGLRDMGTILSSSIHPYRSHGSPCVVRHRSGSWSIYLICRLSRLV